MQSETRMVRGSIMNSETGTNFDDHRISTSQNGSPFCFHFSCTLFNIQRRLLITKLNLYQIGKDNLCKFTQKLSYPLCSLPHGVLFSLFIRALHVLGRLLFLYCRPGHHQNQSNTKTYNTLCCCFYLPFYLVSWHVSHQLLLLSSVFDKHCLLHN